MLAVLLIGAIVIGIQLYATRKQDEQLKLKWGLGTDLFVIMIFGLMLALDWTSNSWLLRIMMIIVMLMAAWRVLDDVTKLRKLKQSHRSRQ